MKMLSPILLFSLLMTGCSAFYKPPVDPYKDSAVKEATNNMSYQQKQMMLFNRQLSVLQDQLQKLETERNILLQELETVRIEANSLGRKNNQLDEIREYQAALASFQARTAETQANASVQTAVIDSEIDTKIASIEANTLELVADLETNRSQSNHALTTKLIAGIQSKKKLRIAQLNNSRRLQMAKVSAKATTDAAAVVAPMLSEHGVHEPTLMRASISKVGPDKKIVRKVREIYDVLYLFTDRKSWNHFNKFLSAYGVTDKFSVVSKNTGEFVTYVGRFYSQKDAQKRKQQLFRRTKTNHAIIRKKTIML